MQKAVRMVVPLGARGARLELLLVLGAVCMMGFPSLAGGAALSQQQQVVAASELTELSIEQLMNIEVYTASRFSQKTTEAPSAVSIVTASDIKTYGYRTLADILNSVRGMYVTYDRNYSYVGVRGFNRPGDYNSRVLLLVDGHRANEPIYDTALIGTEFPLDVDLIDRVEVVRGPGSSVYGSNAVFAVVNVITKRGHDFDGVEMSASAASFGGLNGRLTYGKQYKNGADLLFSATRYHSDGQDLFFPEVPGIAYDLDSENARRLYAKLAFGGFALSSAWSERVKKIPTAAYDSVFNDPRLQSTDTQFLLDLAYYRELAKSWDMSGRLFYGEYTFHGVFPFAGPPVVENVDIGDAKWWGAEVKLVGRLGRHKLVVGAEYQDNLRQDQKNYDVDPYDLILDEKRSSERLGLYVQDELILSDKLLLNAGLRYDDYSTVDGTFNPRLGLIYSPQKATSLKFLYGTAFRAPNAYELYYNDGDVTQKASNSLRPEEIASYEFVAEHMLQPNFRLTAAVYRNEISDLIDLITDTDGLLVFRNTGDATAKGIELEAERVWSGVTRLRASYAWQVTRDDNGTELENSPRHLAKFNYTTLLPGIPLRAGIELQYMSGRKTLAGRSAKEHVLANLTFMNSTLAKGLDISASVYNLFDKHYADPARPEHDPIDLIPQDGRSFRFKLDYRF